MDSKLNKPKRVGRPTGSSRYSKTDPVILASVADILVANPDLTMTAAIRQELGSDDAAGLRRLQAKFSSDATACSP